MAYEARRAREAAEPRRLEDWHIQDFRRAIFTAMSRAQLMRRSDLANDAALHA